MEAPMASYAATFASSLRNTRGQCVISTGCAGNPRGQGRDLAGETSEEDASLEEMTKKKRRLSREQVRSLEENFELERKVEPGKKAQLARDLGLQPRQVAVWFQNRRARYKTKQLQRDYDLLRFDYETLSSDFRVLKQENEKLVAQLGHLKQKLPAENAGGDENSADARGILATSLPSQTGAGPPTISGGARKGILDTGHHPLSRVLLLTENNGSSSSLSSSCNRSVPVGPALFLKEGCLTSDTESSGTLNDVNEESPHSINDSLGVHLGRPSSSVKYSVSDVPNANGEDQFLITPNVYQQFFGIDHTSVRDEACNSFGNVNDQSAAAVPLWDWTP